MAPTILNDTFFNEAWEPAGSLLAVLSALGVTRPVGWVMSSYMQVYGRTRAIMVLEWLKVAAIIGGIALLGALGGVLWACAGVGVAFGVHALGSLWVVKRADGVPYMRLLRPLGRAPGGTSVECWPGLQGLLSAEEVSNCDRPDARLPKGGPEWAQG